MKITSCRYLPLFLLALLILFNGDTIAKPDARQSSPLRVALTPKTLRGKIAFWRDSAVWVFDPATRHESMMWKSPFWQERWSPSVRELNFSFDLQRVAFTHEQRDEEFSPSTGSELYVMNSDGSGKKRLTNTDAEEYILTPRFSPDGSQIVYTRRTGYHNGGQGFSGMEIRVVNSDGSNNRRVIGNIKDVSQSYLEAFWSRDGKRLLFTHIIGNIDYEGEGSNKHELQTCDLDGTQVRPFAGDYSAFHRPDVSPDGEFRAIVQPANPAYSKYPDLRLFTSQDKFVRELILFKPDLNEQNPQWSSDSKRVIFEAMQTYTDVDKENRAQEVHIIGIWAIGRDGKDLRRITTNASLIAFLH